MNIFHKFCDVKLIISMAAFLFLTTVASASTADMKQQIPVFGMVTMVDLGAKKCIPCKMMAPILIELEKEYDGRAAIVFIDVWENPDAGKEFGISTIPTQIFYDDNGKEVFRHVGFFDKAGIVAELKKLGIK